MPGRSLVTGQRSLGKCTGDGLGRQDVVSGPDCLDNMRWYADIDGFQTAGDIGPRKQNMADFWKPESDSGMGPNTGPVDHSRIRVQAGGNINGDDGPIQAVQ